MIKEIIKFIAVMLIYTCFAPLLGWFYSKNRTAERIGLCIMVSMPSWVPGKLTMMINSVELYRGHTKGFEFSIIVASGIAMTTAAFLRKTPGVRLMPPGLWLYLLYCGMSFISIIAAPVKLYVFMAAWKFTTAALIFVGTFHAFRDPKDLRWVQRSLAITLIVQTLVCLKLRYLEGRWQVHGWFEHQNPMAIWAYLCALPLLASSFCKEVSQADMILFLGSVGATALMILLSVSRGGLGALVIGAVAVTGLAYLRGISLRKLTITGMGACAAVAAGLLALDSIMARVEEAGSHEGMEDLRPVLNRMSKTMLHDSAIGIGWNNFGVVNSLPYERYSRVLMDWDESRGFRIIDELYFANPLTESLYWLLLSETGYQGFICYVAFELLTLWWAARGLLRFWKSPLGYFLGGALVALTLTYGHGLVERVLSQTKNMSIWLIFAGFMARIQMLRKTPGPSPFDLKSTKKAFRPPAIAP